ncbi:UBN2 domain-containing protein [Tanacetum coccineum]
MTLYNALPRKEYKRVFMCKTAKEFLISNEETINSGFTRFNAIVTSLKSLDPDYSSKNHVRKCIRALPFKWREKVTAIEEAKDLATLTLDELIKNLKIYEMVLDNDGVVSKTTKEKVKSLALKANITRGQTSNNSTCQDESDEDEEINLMAKNFRKLSRKGVKAFGGNTSYLDSFGEEMDMTTDLHKNLLKIMLTERGDCVASIKRRRHDLRSDDVSILVTPSEHRRPKGTLEDSVS